MIPLRNVLHRILYLKHNGNDLTINPKIQQVIKYKFALMLFCLQTSFGIIYVALVQYGPHADASDARNSVGPVFGGFFQNSHELYRNYNCKYRIIYTQSDYPYYSILCQYYLYIAK